MALVFAGLGQTALADDCMLRLRVSPENVSVNAARTELYLLMERGPTVEFLQDDPWVSEGDDPRLDIVIEHLERSEVPLLGVVYLIRDDGGAVIQSNGLTLISVQDLECYNRWESVRVRSHKSGSLRMIHLDGFDSLDLVLSDADQLPARLAFLSTVLALEMGFQDREYALFESLITRLYSSFSQMSDDQKQQVINVLEDMFLLNDDASGANWNRMSEGYINFLANAVAEEKVEFLVHGGTPIQDYALGALGRVLDREPDRAIHSAALALEAFALRADIENGDPPEARARFARQCMSMSRNALQAVRDADVIRPWDHQWVYSIFYDSVHCLHEHYDLVAGASLYDTQEVMEYFVEDRGRGLQVRRDMSEAFACLPDELKDELLDEEEDDRIAPIVSEALLNSRKC